MRQVTPDSEIRVDIITDISADVVLHWGASKIGSREWGMPDSEVQPEGSVVMHKAVETRFLNCDDDECDVEISGARVPLQRITISLPASAYRRGQARTIPCLCIAASLAVYQSQ